MNTNTNDGCEQDNKVLTISLAMVPKNLNYAIVTSEINDIEVYYILNTGVSGNFLNEDTAITWDFNSRDGYSTSIIGTYNHFFLTSPS